ncbi:hypothetical protein DFH06DRAFT_1305908 [Mycena polygramma]|nr:hypothetical protein DFH06DRAFT_1305908 [Mycena polygramma]
MSSSSTLVTSTRRAWIQALEAGPSVGASSGGSVQIWPHRLEVGSSLSSSLNEKGGALSVCSLSAAVFRSPRNIKYWLQQGGYLESCELDSLNLNASGKMVPFFQFSGYLRCALESNGQWNAFGTATPSSYAGGGWKFGAMLADVCHWLKTSGEACDGQRSMSQMRAHQALAKREKNISAFLTRMARPRIERGFHRKSVRPTKSIVWVSFPAAHRVWYCGGGVGFG